MANKLLKASIGVTIVMLFGYVLSFVREATIANYFGISADVDAYTIAIQIPVMLFSFLTVAVQSVVVPIYSDIYYNKGNVQAKSYIDNLLSILVVFSIAIVVVGEVLSGPIVYLFAPGFNAETHNLSTELLRLTFPSIIFSIVCQVLIAVLNVHKEYVVNSFAVYFLNVTIIVGVVFLHGVIGVSSACVCQLLGEFFKVCFVAFLAKKFYKYKYTINLRDEDVVKTLKMSIPVFWSISVAEVNAIVNRIVGSFLFVGSISALTYAGKINTVLMQLFVSAITTVVYPLYAESTAKHDANQLNKRINSTFSAYSLFVVPLMCFIFVYKREIIELAFARGAFDPEAVDLTQRLLGWYSIGLLFMSLRTTLNNVFYSLKDTRTPAINATVGAIINIILNITLPYFWGVDGIALATSITAIYITTSLLFSMLKKYSDINIKEFYDNLKGIIVSSVTMLLLLVFVYKTTNIESSLLTMIIGVVVAAMTYIILLYTLKVPIFKLLLSMIKKH